MQNNEENIIEEDHLGPMTEFCEDCKAKHLSNKRNSFNDCCSHGEVKINYFPEFPSYLNSLLD